MKTKKVLPIDIENGKIVYNIGSNMASADPRAYSRLMQAGKYEEAKKMQNTPMYRIIKDEGNKKNRFTYDSDLGLSIVKEDNKKDEDNNVVFDKKKEK